MSALLYIFSRWTWVIFRRIFEEFLCGYTSCRCYLKEVGHVLLLCAKVDWKKHILIAQPLGCIVARGQGKGEVFCAAIFVDTHKELKQFNLTKCTCTQIHPNRNQIVTVSKALGRNNLSTFKWLWRWFHCYCNPGSSTFCCACHMTKVLSWWR